MTAVSACRSRTAERSTTCSLIARSAAASRLFVVLPIAEHTRCGRTPSSSIWFTTSLHTSWMRSASRTLLPPNFMITRGDGAVTSPDANRVDASPSMAAARRKRRDGLCKSKLAWEVKRGTRYRCTAKCGPRRKASQRISKPSAIRANLRLERKPHVTTATSSHIFQGVLGPHWGDLAREPKRGRSRREHRSNRSTTAPWRGRGAARGLARRRARGEKSGRHQRRHCAPSSAGRAGGYPGPPARPSASRGRWGCAGAAG